MQRLQTAGGVAEAPADMQSGCGGYGCRIEKPLKTIYLEAAKNLILNPCLRRRGPIFSPLTSRHLRLHHACADAITRFTPVQSFAMRRSVLPPLVNWHEFYVTSS